MIPLDEEQKEALYELTHDLMLISGPLPLVYSKRIAACLDALYIRVLRADPAEAEAAAERAEKEIDSYQSYGDQDAPPNSQCH